MLKVYLVGAGPKDVELLTLKAYRLVSPEVLFIAKSDCEPVYVGREGGKYTLPQ